MDIGKVGHVLFEGNKNCYKLLVEALWRGPDTDGRIILMWVLEQGCADME